jgi:hypothetical protein
MKNLLVVDRRIAALAIGLLLLALAALMIAGSGAGPAHDLGATAIEYGL